MYVDDSGDPGINPQSKYFVLSGMVVHESQWNTFFDNIIDFRRNLKLRKGLTINTEIHASDFIMKNQKVKINIAPRDRLHILKLTLEFLAKQPISIITVRIDKSDPTNANQNFFDYAWTVLLTRFHNTINFENFPNKSDNDYGIVISDQTNQKKLRKIQRKLRVYNPTPNDTNNDYEHEYRNIQAVKIIEDPSIRDSRHSQMIQMVDVVSYFARVTYQPNKRIRTLKARNYYKILDPVVNQHATRNSTKYGIVELWATLRKEKGGISTPSMEPTCTCVQFGTRYSVTPQIYLKVSKMSKNIDNQKVKAGNIRYHAILPVGRTDGYHWPSDCAITIIYAIIVVF